MAPFNQTLYFCTQAFRRCVTGSTPRVENNRVIVWKSHSVHANNFTQTAANPVPEMSLANRPGERESKFCTIFFILTQTKC